jgi:hypothetical protein
VEAVQDTDSYEGPARVKAALVDPHSMKIIWMNEAAAHSVERDPIDPASGVTIDRLVPMSDALGVAAALREVADSGTPQHMQTDLVSTARGSVAIVISIYRMPEGALLMLMENAWQPHHGQPGGGARRRAGRGAR